MPRSGAPAVRMTGTPPLGARTARTRTSATLLVTPALCAEPGSILDNRAQIGDNDDRYDLSGPHGH